MFNAAPYAVSTPTLGYADISTDAVAALLPGAMGDQSSEFVDFSGGNGYFLTSNFTFPLYGMWQTDSVVKAFNRNMLQGIDVGDNGYVSFLRTADVTPLPLPSADTDTLFQLAPLWDDLIQGQVHALVTGTAPNRILTIQWKDAARARDIIQKYSFQIRLHETTGVIDVLYKSAALAAGASYGLNYGDGTTYVGCGTPSNNASYVLTPNGW